VKTLQDRLFKLENVEPIWNSTVSKIYGKDFVEGITIKNKIDSKETSLELNGVFVAIGNKPNIEFLNNQVELISGSWIKTDSRLETNVPGVYAIGDIRDTYLRQVVMSVADGALAVSSLTKYL
jgi:thioredoxin reductase (NADPH)